MFNQNKLVRSPNPSSNSPNFKQNVKERGQGFNHQTQPSHSSLGRMSKHKSQVDRKIQSFSNLKLGVVLTLLIFAMIIALDEVYREDLF